MKEMSKFFMDSGVNLVFNMMKHILEEEYDGIHKENAKYFCEKIAEVFDEELDEENKEYFLT